MTVQCVNHTTDVRHMLCAHCAVHIVCRSLILFAVSEKSLPVINYGDGK